MARDPGSATVASEFVGTSVTSEGSPHARFSAFLPENPPIRYFESRERGYARVEAKTPMFKEQRCGAGYASHHGHRQLDGYPEE